MTRSMTSSTVISIKLSCPTITLYQGYATMEILPPPSDKDTIREHELYGAVRQLSILREANRILWREEMEAHLAQQKEIERKQLMKRLIKAAIIIGVMLFIGSMAHSREIQSIPFGDKPYDIYLIERNHDRWMQEQRWRWHEED